MKHSEPIACAVIGYGSIAKSVSVLLDGDPAFVISHCMCRPGRSAAARAALGKIGTLESSSDLPPSIGIVLDCAGHGGLRAHGPDLLRRGVDVISVSSGALADAEFSAELESAASAGGSTLRIASGAVGGMDALSAARLGGLHSVTYTARKPPLSWAGSPAEKRLDLHGVDEPTVHFRGSARDAATLYPQNANVAATIALAGVGFDTTEVCLIADPDIGANRHSVDAQGSFGSLSFSIEGIAAADNPKSSAITAMSLVKCLHDRAARVVI